MFTEKDVIYLLMCKAMDSGKNDIRFLLFISAVSNTAVKMVLFFSYTVEVRSISGQTKMLLDNSQLRKYRQDLLTFRPSPYYDSSQSALVRPNNSFGPKSVLAVN